MKRMCIILCVTIICCTHTIAQETVVSNYLQEAGTFAEIYNGRIEAAYNMVLYENLPYYKNSDFTEVTVFYRKNYYPNQKARLDLFREQLVVVPPGKQYAVVVGAKNVEKICMYGKTFVWISPPKEHRLKEGYYMQLKDGGKTQLFCKETYLPQKRTQYPNVTFRFDHKIQYYLQYNNQYHAVKNKASFTKIFPQYKKQINKFVKGHSLDFKQNPDGSLIVLANYCEELLNLTNTP